VGAPVAGTDDLYVKVTFGTTVANNQTSE
jgi:hypothetical protein